MKGQKANSKSNNASTRRGKGMGALGYKNSPLNGGDNISLNDNGAIEQNRTFLKCISNEQKSAFTNSGSVRVVVKEDDSVSKLINNKKDINFKEVFKNFCGAVVTLVSVFVFFMLAFCVFNVEYFKLAPSIAGYTTCKVVTGSMTESGFNVGDRVVVRSVDASTLRGAKRDEYGNIVQLGDIIAFYVDSSALVTKSELELVDTSSNNVKYQMTFWRFWGFQNTHISNVSKQGAKIYFHHIVDVFEDADGKLWFSTMGSSNSKIDQEEFGVGNYINCGYVSEDMILGVYDAKTSSSTFAKVLNTIFESKLTIPIMYVLIVLFVLIALFDVFKSIASYYYTFKLLEGKITITHKKCQEYKVADNLNDYEKLKLLEEVDILDSAEAIKILFSSDEGPISNTSSNVHNFKYKRKHPNYTELKKIYAKKRIECMKSKAKKPVKSR